MLPIRSGISWGSVRIIRSRSFQVEYVMFLRKRDIDFNNRYL
jgi:hypothetical protein